MGAGRLANSLGAAANLSFPSSMYYGHCVGVCVYVRMFVCIFMMGIGLWPGGQSVTGWRCGLSLNLILQMASKNKITIK